MNRWFLAYSDWFWIWVGGSGFLVAQICSEERARRRFQSTWIVSSFIRGTAYAVMDAMVFEAQLVSDSQGSATANGSGGESRAEVNVDASVSIHAADVPTSSDTENPKVIRESVFNRLTYLNVVGGEKAGILDFFSPGGQEN
ncbi:hypothetical protein L6452_38698 [Arctium lappa]|uniref:Uncharacterized protein n=1 Tax=Arctium lappa TaxID=4217 RepID=A0ACB8XUD3_ARCLA|nr:hypothetical protein L6452_38698 [Arctium lappa]